MLKNILIEEFKEFQNTKNYTVVIGDDIVNNRVFLKIYKNNLTLEEQYKIICKIENLELNKNNEIYICILENIENRMNSNYNGSFTQYSEDIKYKYNKTYLQKQKYIERTKGK